jgi:hypothetical protein
MIRLDHVGIVAHEVLAFSTASPAGAQRRRVLLNRRNVRAWLGCAKTLTTLYLVMSKSPSGARRHRISK